MHSDPDLQRHLPLSAMDLQILLTLQSAPRHGYTMIKEIAARTRGEIVIGTSTLYAAIKRLRGEGLVQETERPAGETSEDRRRRYYVVTEVGREVLHAEAHRIDDLRAMLVEGGLLENGFARRA